MFNLPATPFAIAMAALAVTAAANPSPPKYVQAPSANTHSSYSPSGPTCGSGNNGTFIVFGDSYSDIGSRWKIVEHFSPDFNPPPWFEGRYSNGFMWNEWVGTRLDKTLANFAFGDGTSGSQHTIAPVPNIQDQVEFFGQQRNEKRFQTPEDDTVVIEIGTNDIVYGLNNHSFKSQKDTIEFANVVADNIRKVVKKMIGYGFKNFHISNVPPIYFTPRIAQLNSVELTKSVVADFNHVYEQVFAEFAKNHPDINVSVFDTYSLVYPIITQLLPDLQIKNGIETSCVIKDLQGNPLSYCTDPDQFVWQDFFHPTRKIHKLIGLLITKMIQNCSYVPTIEDMRQIIKDHVINDIAEPVAVNEYRADGSYDDIDAQILNQPKRPQPPQKHIDNGKEIPYRLNHCSSSHY
ncbi:hypothetical protein H4R99_003333 [Coemansia sp. RSA 1722]|nr:hypothetical protein IWW45_003321 [Coemansia sp. RSA 485]KAJ2600446.1 hypothetical protein H4R99_003333 [Coemansia sp. RSA 1722]